MTYQDGRSWPGRAMWTYWVAFSHETGTSAVAVNVGTPLETADQVVSLAAWIEADAQVRRVTVLSWQVLSAPDQPPAGPAAGSPAGRGPVDRSVSTPVAGAGPVEVVALAQVLAAAERFGLPLRSVHVYRGSGGGVELSLSARSAPGVEDGERFLVEVGCVLTEGDEYLAASGTEMFRTRCGVLELPGGVVEVTVICEPGPIGPVTEPVPIPATPDTGSATGGAGVTW
jgi:hypothetical protein